LIDPKAAPMEVIEHSIADGTNSQGRSGEITNEENVPVV
jgi:hypothetical protein